MSIDFNDEDPLNDEELAELKRQEEELRAKVAEQIEEIGKLDKRWLAQHQTLLEKSKAVAKSFKKRELELRQAQQVKSKELRQKRQHLNNLRPKTLHEERINVSARLKALKCDPVEIMAAIAMGDSRKLGTDETIRIFERRMAAQELMGYIAPKLAAKQHEDTDQVETIPVFVPKRGDLVPQDVLSGEFEELDDE
jgi:predicted RNA binding protein with dsRBD fold (UPF0201 family)